MKNLFIKARLNSAPTHKHICPLLVVTKGATAELSYNWSGELYSLDDIEQLTFMFKQGRNIIHYNMFHYLVKTTDTVVDSTKTYFTDIRPVAENSYQCTATWVETPVGNPTTANYYELVTDDSGERNDTYYMIDDRFYYEFSDKYDLNMITFNLSALETNQFKTTRPGSEVIFEVATKLNTDRFANLRNQDSIIIEPQPPIAVVDSLYSKIK